jgi:hypothetical protein
MNPHENHPETWRSRQKLQSVLAALFFCLVFSPLAVAQSFRVPGNSGRNWVDTGLDLAPGTLIQVNASGEVDVGAGWGRFGPEGTTKFANVPGYPAETRYRYGLVARLTASRTDPNDDLREEWSYGERREYCAGRGGHLWLTVNDDDPGNNEGEFTVELRRGTCRSEPTTVTQFVSVYTTKRRPAGVRSRRFTVGETVVLRVENNSPRSIYYLVPIPTGTEIIRGEGLVVQRNDGRDWVSAVNRAFIDEPAYRFLALASRMNITRQWTSSATAPGTYRVAFTYYHTPDTNTYESNPNRGGGITIYSETFEVVR